MKKLGKFYSIRAVIVPGLDGSIQVIGNGSLVLFVVGQIARYAGYTSPGSARCRIPAKAKIYATGEAAARISGDSHAVRVLLADAKSIRKMLECDPTRFEHDRRRTLAEAIAEIAMGRRPGKVLPICPPAETSNWTTGAVARCYDISARMLNIILERLGFQHRVWVFGRPAWLPTPATLQSPEPLAVPEKAMRNGRPVMFLRWTRPGREAIESVLRPLGLTAK